MNLFLTGTDTDVGKTYVACAIVRELRREGFGTVGLKPISCGSRADAIALHKASEGALELDAVNPLHFATPASPYMAAILESRPVDPAVCREAVRQAAASHPSVIVEGVGGWFVPITRDYFVSDLAAELGLPVAVVVANRLGALNHTFLTVRAVKARGVRCVGVILNEPRAPLEGDSLLTAGNRMILEDLLEVPILGEMGFGDRVVRWREPVFGLATLLAPSPTPPTAAELSSPL